MSSEIILDRLSRLEIEHAALRSRLRRGRYALVLIAVAGLVMGAAATQPASKPNAKTLTADQVIAGKFILVAPSGQTRGVFGTLEDGSTAVLLTDERHSAGIGLTVGADGNTTMIFSDVNGKTRARVEVRRDGEPGLTFFDAAERERADLSLSHGSHPEFRMTDADGNPRVRFAIEPDGWSRAQLLDNADHPRISLVSHPQKAGGLFLLDDKNVPRVTAVTMESGNPHIETAGADGKPIWQTPK